MLSVGYAAATPTTYSDPVGYYTFTVPAHSKRVLPAPFVHFNGFDVHAVSVGGNSIELSGILPPGSLGVADSGYLGVREGAMAGISFKVTGFSGATVFVQEPPIGLVQAGDRLEVIRDWTLGEVFDPETTNVLTGPDPNQSDGIGILNPATQTLENFYFKEGVGWTEVGAATEGDRGTTAFCYPSALQYVRRSDVPLDVVVIGKLAVPYEGYRYVHVYPGRNLVSSPFTSATSLDEWGLYDPLSPYSIKAGASAPQADTLRITYADGSTSAVIYRNPDSGWHEVGGGDGSSLSFELTMGVDLHRVGPPGFIRMGGVFPPPEAMAAASARTPVEEVPIDLSLCGGSTAEIGWKSKPGMSYQVQIRPVGEVRWQTFGDPVVADAEVCKVVRKPKGSGLFRVIKLP